MSVVAASLSAFTVPFNNHLPGFSSYLSQYGLNKKKDNSFLSFSPRDFENSINKDDHNIWISNNEASRLADLMSISLPKFDALHIEVLLMDVENEIRNGIMDDKEIFSMEVESTQTTKSELESPLLLRRINYNDFPSSFLIDYIPTNSFLKTADFAIDSTLRWCDSFVAELGLCPWARASINTRKAIRFKIVPLFSKIEDGSSFEHMEKFVRISSEELARLAGCLPWEEHSKEDDCTTKDLFDPNVAITFIMAVPFPLSVSTKNSSNNLSEGNHAQYVSKLSSKLPVAFQFSNFVQYFNELDDDFFLEAEDFELKNNIKNERMSKFTKGSDYISPPPPLGTFVTLAPFHPFWRFASDSFEDDDDDDNDEDLDQSIDFEKRAPFPTISVVLTKAILDAGGEEATGRIGTHNEEILGNLSVKHLQKIYLSNVIQGDKKIKP